MGEAPIKPEAVRQESSLGMGEALSPTEHSMGVARAN